ncbi:cell division cycle 7-related protein kinase-like isoform X1 [Hylaeus anthracinus]|uniref:cell division cycle 7-related protein kinase-like isoform X1 n=1 Tax=Hylaeus volcanicus TaxID=313075 RepID=UPI0023B86585|nr:cell division cycle 7-related protein kinase-like isoform X1 [Hylaeus volcanicus]XP_054014569.1 cell division cycle 7-related protein kinase-like isoform X1 [Hylaeus anthracinus]
MEGKTQIEEDNEDEEDNVVALKNRVPLLKDLFRVHGKVGEGTFSSVFLATLKSSDGTKKFALKHLVPTRHPEKIERELQCMQQIGGKDYVVGLELCLRSFETVVFVMPYMRHDKFSDYVQNMTLQETKDYMIALLTALRRVHQFKIIHRDVKPSNFLYDRCNKRYLLVDFGLAQEYIAEDKSNKLKSINFETQSVKRKRSDENSLNLSLSSRKKVIGEKCYCFGKPKVCSLCTSRPEQIAPRAGTPGFRAPEVLLKHPSQTPAIDIWASGVMMLCILSGTQPFFHSPDDCTALAEITTIFGSNKMQQCAHKLGKKIIFNEDIPGVDIVSLCQKLQKRNKGLLDNCKDHRMYEKASTDVQFPKEAYHLLLRLLDLNHKTRLTAEQALDHPFLKL